MNEQTKKQVGNGETAEKIKWGAMTSLLPSMPTHT